MPKNAVNLQAILTTPGWDGTRDVQRRRVTDNS